MSIKTYKYTEEGARMLAKSGIKRTMPIMVIIPIVVLYVKKGEESFFSNANILTMALFLIFIGISIIFSIRFNSKMFLKNEFNLYDDRIERVTPSGKTISFKFANINECKVLNNGLLLAVNKQKMLVPNGIDGYDELSKTLLIKIK